MPTASWEAAESTDGTSAGGLLWHTLDVLGDVLEHCRRAEVHQVQLTLAATSSVCRAFDVVLPASAANGSSLVMAVDLKKKSWALAVGSAAPSKRGKLRRVEMGDDDGDDDLGFARVLSAARLAPVDDASTSMAVAPVGVATPPLVVAVPAHGPSPVRAAPPPSRVAAAVRPRTDAAGGDTETEEDEDTAPPPPKAARVDSSAGVAAAAAAPKAIVAAAAVTAPAAAAAPAKAVVAPAPTAKEFAAMWTAAAAAPLTPAASAASSELVAAASTASTLSSAPSTASTAAAAAAASTHVPSVAADVVAAQSALGAQSLRSQPYDLGPCAGDKHGKMCFDKMLSREKQLSGEWAVFYHSYSFAALLYEVQAAVAAVLFRFKSEFATLPRLLKEAFNEIPDAAALQAEFPKFKTRDHDPKFRAVGISATSSLLAEDSEAPPKRIFLMGYSCADLSFVGVLENLLVSCGVPASKKTDLAKKIVTVSESYGLDCSQFKGKRCSSGRAGHMLQIFVKRSLVNRYVYAALPYGVTDKKRPDLEKYLEGKGPISGQIRIVTNPSVFMRGSAVRMYVYSADDTFHKNRPAYQQELTKLLEPIIGTPDLRVKAAEGIYAGKLPPWFSATDFEEQSKARAAVAPVAAAAAAAPPADDDDE